jgi:hypothetical protein
LGFCEDQQINQLDSSGLNGKHVLNQLPLTDSLTTQGPNAQERYVEPSSEDNVIVHEFQIEGILEDNDVVAVPEDVREQMKISSTQAKTH